MLDVVVIVTLVTVFIAFLALRNTNSSSKTFQRVVDRYFTYEELEAGLRKAGLEASDLIVAIDCTKSNETQGRKSWHPHLSLHALPMDGQNNPYQAVLTTCGRALEPFDADHKIPLLMFGDSLSRGKSCRYFNGGQPCYTFVGALEAYNREIPEIDLSGPTNFAPVIREACKIADEERSFHILVIICDGMVTSPKETAQAIVDACQSPLSIVIIGVGDGDQSAPRGEEWKLMEEYDDELPERLWDNVQFVPYNKVLAACPPDHDPNLYFATWALQEVPAHYIICKELGLLYSLNIRHLNSR